MFNPLTVFMIIVFIIVCLLLQIEYIRYLDQRCYDCALNISESKYVETILAMVLDYKPDFKSKLKAQEYYIKYEILILSNKGKEYVPIYNFTIDTYVKYNPFASTNVDNVYLIDFYDRNHEKITKHDHFLRLTTDKQYDWTPNNTIQRLKSLDDFSNCMKLIFRETKYDVESRFDLIAPNIIKCIMTNKQQVDKLIKREEL